MSQLNLTCSSSPPWCRAGPSLITLGALLPHPPHPVTLKVLRSHPSALILPVCLLSSYAHHSLWMAVPARPPPSWFTSTLRLERPSQCPSLVMSCIPQPHKSFPGPHCLWRLAVEAPRCSPYRALWDADSWPPHWPCTLVTPDHKCIPKSSISCLLFCSSSLLSTFIIQVNLTHPSEGKRSNADHLA